MHSHCFCSIAGSPPPSPHGHRYTPQLEEALRAVRGSPAPESHARRGTYDGTLGTGHTGSASSSRASSATYGSRSRTESVGGGSTASGYSQRAESATSNRSYSNHSLNARTAEHARQVAARTELHSSSLRNLTSSRSLFEAQLEQHQQNLAEHQLQALNHFNAAIRQEIDADTTLHGTSDLCAPEITRSESVSSVDSLEGGEEEGPDRDSTPVGQGSNSQSDSNLLTTDTKVTGSDSGFSDQGVKPVNNIYISHSESSLSTTQNNNNNTSSGVIHGGGQQSVYPQYTAGEGNDMSATTAFSRSAVATNIPPSSGSGFILHRSLSATNASNVAVVQPISSGGNHVGQTPNSAYNANHHQNHHPQKPPPHPNHQGSAAATVITNGYHGQGNMGRQHQQPPASSVQGKEGALIGPLSGGSQVAGRQQYYAEQVIVNHVSTNNNNPIGSSNGNNNHFYLSNYNGAPYAGNPYGGEAFKQVHDEDFHARTKAWVTPSPDLKSPLSVNGQAANGVKGSNNVSSASTTNTKPYSSRVTATNSTLHASSQIASSNAYTLPAYSAQAETNNNPPPTFSYQTGTVYSKGSIPSTVIASNYPPNGTNKAEMPHSASSTIGTTPAATALTTQPAPPVHVPTDQAEEKEQSTEDEEETEENEEEPEKVVKGILKPSFNANAPPVRGRGRAAVVVAPVKGYTAQLQARGRGRGYAQPPPEPSPSPGARDSLEMTRENLGQVSCNTLIIIDTELI